MPTRSALIVANSEFSDPKLKQLRAPAHDADALARVLKNPAVGAFSVEIVLDETEAIARRRLASFFRDRSRDDLLFLHLSCHGVKDEDAQLYFAMRDTEVDHLEATGIEASWLRRLLDRSRSRRIVVMLDCCHSGAFGSDLLARGDSGVHLKENLGGQGRAVITASDALQYAFEGDEVHGNAGPSLFTRAVVDGLATGAADRDGDGRISVSELFDHVRESLREATPNQTPRMWQLDVDGELYIAQAPKRAARFARESRPEEVPDLKLVIASSVRIPSELKFALESPLAAVREGATNALERLLRSSDAQLRGEARALLQALAGDDSRPVSEAARRALETAQVDQVFEKRVQWQAEDIHELAQMRHDGVVRSVAFTSDGHMLGTASDDGTVQLWDARNGRQLRRMAHDRRNVFSAVFSPDGRLIASASADKTARLWETATGRQRMEMTHPHGLSCVAFSPDGGMLATGGLGREARVWSVTTGRELAQLEHVLQVSAVAFSPDGSTLATASQDKTARLWDATNGDELARMLHDGWVWRLAFAHDGRRLVTAGRDKKDKAARVWDTATGRELARIAHDRGVFDVAFSPDSRTVATASEDATAGLWESASGHRLAQLTHDDVVWAVAFSPDGGTVATGSKDATARVWEAASGHQLAQLIHDGGVVAVAFSPDGRTLATACGDGTVRLWGAAGPARS